MKLFKCKIIRFKKQESIQKCCYLAIPVSKIQSNAHKGKYFFQNKYCISSVRTIRSRRQQSIQKCHIFSAKTETRQNRFCFLPWEFLSLTPCFIREFKIWILIHNLTTTTSTGTLLFPGRSGGIEFEKPKWRGKKKTYVGLF